MKLSRWKEPIRKYSHFAWWGGCAFLVLACVGLAVSYWLSGHSESKQAFEAGRRLVIALDTGEIKGKIIALDALPNKTSEPAAEPIVQEKEPAPDAKAEELKTDPVEPAMDTPSDEPSATGKTPEQKPESRATPMPGVNSALIEKTEAGDLPIISSDGTKPWRAYSKSFERKRNQPMVAIVISGLGQSRETTEKALELNEYFTVSFSPYAKDISSWGAATRVHGHELLVDLPMQSTSYPAADPGPQGLLLEKGESDSNAKLRWLMSRFPTSMGFLTPQSEAFTGNEEAFRFLMQSLANRGLLLLMGHEPPKKETREQIDTSQKTILISDLLIDEELSAAAIQSRLSQLEDVAKKHGYAVGVAQSYPITIEQLRVWAETLSEKGIILVPLSAIVKLRFS